MDVLYSPLVADCLNPTNGMSLTLHSTDLERLRAVTGVLLAPLDYEEVDVWCRDVLARAEALFSADRSLMLLPRGEGILFVSESLPEASLERFRALPRAVEPRAVRVRRPDAEHVMRRRRTAGLEVWSNALLHRLAGIPVEDSPFYREVMVPAGVTHGRGLATALPLGEAWLSLAYSDPASDPFEEEAGLELLHLLLPSLKAGVQLLVRAGRQRGELANVLDHLADSLLVCTLEGEELHRNCALRRLLEREAEADALIAAARASARAAGTLRSRESKTRSSRADRHGTRTVRTATGHYQLHPVSVSETLMGPRPVTMVLVEPRTQQLPTADRLRERYGLTPREAEVTLLLARGASNRRMADELGISPHTVGTHSEHIFRKLGIHSRKALALELLRRNPPA